MTPEAIRAILVAALGGIAPEADISRLDPKANLREELDIDSLDFLNMVIALHERLKIDIPERDYRRLFTLDGAIEYLVEKTTPKA